MPEHDPHVTFPDCPNCQARQKAVANWEHMRWFCFACGATGTWTIASFVDKPPAPEAA